MKIHIEVKEQHILEGACGEIFNCAIAKAVQDVFPFAFVDGECIHFPFRKRKEGESLCEYNHGLWYCVKHNQYDWISEFDSLDAECCDPKDRLKKVQPFSFEIEVDPEQIFPQVDISEATEIINSSLNCKVV